MPVVPWAHVTTGQPPDGAVPLGTAIRPVTAMSFPATDREWYITRETVPFSPAWAGSASVLMMSPGWPGGSGSGTW